MAIGSVVEVEGFGRRLENKPVPVEETVGENMEGMEEAGTLEDGNWKFPRKWGISVPVGIVASLLLNPCCPSDANTAELEPKLNIGTSRPNGELLVPNIDLCCKPIPGGGWLAIKFGKTGFDNISDKLFPTVSFWPVLFI